MDLYVSSIIHIYSRGKLQRTIKGAQRHCRDGMHTLGRCTTEAVVYHRNGTLFVIGY
jgi:hypothetical protein